VRWPASAEPAVLDLVLGAARSGKSKFAQRLAASYGAAVVYAATAAATDPEMQRRIARHRADRPPHWRTVEVEAELHPRAFQASEGDTVLVDGIGVWLGGLIYRLSAEAENANNVSENSDTLHDIIEETALAAADRLASWAVGRRGSTLVVSEEVGWGVVPAYQSGRLFRDVLGRLNQRLAVDAARVFVVVAGVAVDLKQLQFDLETGGDRA
jgi:adenosylcobinamide kinase/adenosylcobinamide-phosphate guanylyltransferase